MSYKLSFKIMKWTKKYIVTITEFQKFCKCCVRNKDYVFQSLWQNKPTQKVIGNTYIHFDEESLSKFCLFLNGFKYETVRSNSFIFSYLLNLKVNFKVFKYQEIIYPYISQHIARW